MSGLEGQPLQGPERVFSQSEINQQSIQIAGDFYSFAMGLVDVNHISEEQAKDWTLVVTENPSLALELMGVLLTDTSEHYVDMRNIGSFTLRRPL